MEHIDIVKLHFMQSTSFKNVSGNWQFRGDVSPEMIFNKIKSLIDANEKMKGAIDSLVGICERHGLVQESEIWMQKIGYAKQISIEYDHVNQALNYVKYSP